MKNNTKIAQMSWGNIKGEKYYFIFNYIIGILLAGSGFLKSLDTQAFIRIITLYGLPLPELCAMVIIGLEISLGLCWLIRWNTRQIATITLLLIILFTFLLLYGSQFKQIEDCGCMGSFIKVPVWIALVRNSLMIVLIFGVLRVSSSDSTLSVAKMYLLLGGSWVGFALASISINYPITTRSDMQIGQHVKTTSLSVYSDKLSGKKAFAFVFNPRCSHCWNASENIKNLKETPEYSEVIGIVANDSDVTEYINTVNPNFEIYQIPTQLFTNSFQNVPVLIEFENGYIKNTYGSGQIPSGIYLKHFVEPTSHGITYHNN